ncbi:hypothetical protein LJR289_002002 [Pseudoduganella sp. LjRoot289]|uniref:hypothetical protein n=1 Tax=Pseudoduganella sp. LjRoot289 TaxID=3342314 RepID=UPI003ECC4EBE
MKKYSVKISSGAGRGKVVQVSGRASSKGSTTVTFEPSGVVRGGTVIIRNYSFSERQAKERAGRQLAQIASSPISDDQRARAKELVDKAKHASESAVTAKFRRTHAA